MYFKLRRAKHGSHHHIDVFVGPDQDHLALSGKLVMREDEADDFCARFEEPDPDRCTCEPWYCGHAKECPQYKGPS